MGVYVESLCPGCRNFISTMLKPAVAKGLGAIMDLTIVPYGNAKASSSGKVSCQVRTCGRRAGRSGGLTEKTQHGPEECFLNKVEQCVLHHFPAKALDYIFCLEDEKSPVGTALAIECALAGGIHWTAMSTCAKGEEGEKYQVEAAAATPKDHKWVPWVTVDGVNIIDDDITEEKFVAAVCNAFKGDVKPAVCGPAAAA